VNLRPHSQDLPGRFAEAISASKLIAEDLVGVAFSEEDERLMRRFSQEGRLFLSRIERPTTLKDAATLFHGAKAALGMRLHFAVLAAMAQIPLLVAPYDPKVEAFAVRYRVPLWREGNLLTPQAPAAPKPEVVQNEMDALCRRVLTA